MSGMADTLYNHYNNNITQANCVCLLSWDKTEFKSFHLNILGHPHTIHRIVAKHA